jgi:hypothetical protein
MHNFLGRDGFTWFIGVVEERADPVKMGRVRVRAFGWHTDDKVEVPTEALPWAIVMNSTNSASVSGYGHSPSGLFEGSWVFGFFMDGDRAQEPVVLGSIPGYPELPPNGDKGFNDPYEIYPEYLDEPDVNRRAVADPDNPHDIEKAKEDGQSKSIARAHGGPSWDEPLIKSRAIYPFNHVYESEAGHMVEFDDTLGAERIQEYHVAGTFYEIDENGNKVTRVVGDDYDITIKDKNVYVKGNCNITVDGNASTYVKGNWDMQVDGNLVQHIKGNVTTKVDGRMDTNVAGEIARVSGNHIVDNAPKIDLNPPGGAPSVSISPSSVASSSEQSIQNAKETATSLGSDPTLVAGLTAEERAQLARLQADG